MRTSPQTVQGIVIPGRSRIADLLQLTKPGIMVMVLVTAALGFFLGGGGRLDPGLLVPALLGIALAGGAGNALNMAMEWRSDARMSRTAGRPLPAGRLSPAEAVAWGTGAGLAGLALLAWAVNPATALLTAATVLIYLFLYTPLKKMTPLCTLVGAVPGAMPPVLGWTAATGRPEAGAWVLFAILFCWQLPHFLPLSWIYREDYARGGYRLLSVTEEGGRRTGFWALLTAGALLLASLLPAAAGMAGGLYLGGATALGAGFVALAAGFALRRDRTRARRLFLGSLAYLPLLAVLMSLDKVLAP